MIWFIQVVHVPANVLFLNGTVETFDVGVHLGLFRVVVVVNNMSLFSVLSEVLVKLSAIVSLNTKNGERQYIF